MTWDACTWWAEHIVEPTEDEILRHRVVESQRTYRATRELHQRMARILGTGSVAPEDGGCRPLSGEGGDQAG